MSKDPNAVIVFQDEVHFNVESTVTSQWYQKGSCPKVRSYPGRVSVAYSGFVIPETGQLFVTKPERFTYETVIDSIRQFINSLSFESDKKVYLFMDNATWHTKAKRLIESITVS